MVAMMALQGLMRLTRYLAMDNDEYYARSRSATVERRVAEHRDKTSDLVPAPTIDAMHPINWCMPTVTAVLVVAFITR